VPTFPLTHGGTPGGVVIGDYANQPGDVSFVITQMLSMTKNRQSVLFHRIDAHRVGVGGHSLGAFTTFGFFNTCCIDPRVDAAVTVAGFPAPYPGQYAYASGPPQLLLHGTADSLVPYQGSVTGYANAVAPKFFVSLLGADHVPFRLGGNPPSVYDPVILDSIVDFYDRYLRHDRKALDALEQDANVPNVASLQEVVK
jgi:hypothetical protein